MSFYVNNQKFSDKEIAEGVKQRKQERRDWCEQQAREYLATKTRKKFYLCEVYYPEVDDERYLRIYDDDVERIKAALAEDLEENGPYKDDEDERDSRREVFRYLDLRGYYIDPYGEVEINDVNLDDYIYCYGVRVMRFDNQGEKKKYDDYYNITLTDEEYIQLVTELLYAPSELSFDGLKMVLPDICNKIWGYCYNTSHVSAIILEEINKDVDAILQQHGGREKTPHVGVFDNPFAQIAEYVASRAEQTNDEGTENSSGK